MPLNIAIVKENNPNCIDGERLYILGFRPSTLPLNSTRSLAFHFSNPFYLQSISTQHNFSSRIRTTSNDFTMSNDIPNDWFLVKLTRWEDGHETSSALLPKWASVCLQAHLGLLHCYRERWQLLRPNQSSLGAALRQGDGIEGLSVDWQGLEAGDWPSQRTLVTEFNLPGVSSTVLSKTVDSTELPGAPQTIRAF
ncbi:uncharacterized protein EAF02_005851 [Botrytis sinoallii]|uniref:uncharacterized protein n=1 Tax=Botrytis sinoallii TaxID=1463999 RepID=UPI00190261E1|nr:uncharacterized protein EAF02_005851 [Botrytis sinoallii]KAF7882488.1 hypothetical protein EAF02_005851 [Botrytis sinoallii]